MRAAKYERGDATCELPNERDAISEMRATIILIIILLIMIMMIIINIIPTIVIITRLLIVIFIIIMLILERHTNERRFGCGLNP